MKKAPMKHYPQWVRSVLSQLGKEVRVRSVHRVGGGCTSRAWKVETHCPGDAYFIKENDIGFLDNFRAESEGLGLLSRSTESVDGLEVPTVLFAGVVDDRACLILKWIDATSDPIGEFQYGRAIAKMHVSGRTDDRLIGHRRNNYLGATVQINTPPTATGRQGWIDFVGEHRLGSQIALAKDRGLASTDLDEAVVATIRQLPYLLEGRRDETTLLHGDLWSGNAFSDVDGNVVLIDPAVYRGCAEAEFGMINLFGGVGVMFNRGYQSVVELPEGWQRRVDVYVLYHLLNHLNLFGASYLGQCERLAVRLARAI